MSERLRCVGKKLEAPLANVMDREQRVDVADAMQLPQIQKRIRHVALNHHWA